MTILDIICEDTSLKYLFYIIAIAQILRNIVTFSDEEEKSKKQNRNINKVKHWMLIIHAVAFIIDIVLIFIIKPIFNLFQILCIIFNISIIIVCFIQIIKNVKSIKIKEFSKFEINSFLIFSYFIILVFNKEIINALRNALMILEVNHLTFYECLTLILLIIKVFFISFFGLYGMLIIIRNIGQVFSKFLEKLKYKPKFFKKIYDYIISDDMYFYDFVLLNKYKKIKVLIPLLFIVDLIILMICDMLIFFIFLIKYPILAIAIIIRYIHNFLCDIKNLNIASFTFKWFRIMIIFSITFTYIVLKLFKMNISSNIMEIFELISTVILIPLIFDQLFKFKEKKKN